MLRKRVFFSIVLSVFVSALLCPPAHGHDRTGSSPGGLKRIDRLALLLITLYGEEGLAVDSQSTLPDGSDHTAHFNAGQRVSAQRFNFAVGNQITAVPIPSPASSFTYQFDEASGVFTRSTASLGPIFGERVETIGKGRFAIGFSYQHFAFEKMDGVDLQEVHTVFQHDDPAPGGRADVVTTETSLDAKVDRFTTLLSYGITDRFDFSLAFPLVRSSVRAQSVATIQRIGTWSDRTIHYFDDLALPGEQYGDSQTFESYGSAAGIGDVILRMKGSLWRSAHLGLGAGMDVRFPTGDALDLLGSGSFGASPFAVLSANFGRFSPHVNVGYEWNGKSVLAGDVSTGDEQDAPDILLLTAGADAGITSWLTVAGDVAIRRIDDTARLKTSTFTALDGQSEFKDSHFESSAATEADLALGLKVNPVTNLLFVANVTVALDDAGLRSDFTPVIGLQYTF
ncbi:MAG: hypothetical protein HYV63_12060 [Candidatus Schekmanbacteria bacterium]|nr:hypothetical protein [Candidatus Schekmanbacteria bacterium]